MNDPVLDLNAITHAYQEGKAGELEVLRQVSLTLAPGEIVALLGPSGAGKSTLLHIAGLLDRPVSGDVRIQGRRANDLPDAARTAIRRDQIGFVYQFHHLLPEFTAEENVVLPQLAAGRARGRAKVRAQDLLGSLGLADRKTHLPAELSGGEQQRVAIARALANGPALLLADEPTGNLDEKTSDTVFDELLALTRDSGMAALIATHNLDLAHRMDRIVRIADHQLVPQD